MPIICTILFGSFFVIEDLYLSPNLFGKNFDEYSKEAQQPILVAMIEHINSLKELESIIEVDGLDAILIGMWDLSASIGKTADFKHPDFVAVMDQIQKISKKSKIPFGVHLEKPIAENLEFVPIMKLILPILFHDVG